MLEGQLCKITSFFLKNDKELTNESIPGPPLKMSGQRSRGDLIKWKQYAGLIHIDSTCPCLNRK